MRAVVAGGLVALGLIGCAAAPVPRAAPPRPAPSADDAAMMKQIAAEPPLVALRPRPVSALPPLTSARTVAWPLAAAPSLAPRGRVPTYCAGDGATFEERYGAALCLVRQGEYHRSADALVGLAAIAPDALRAAVATDLADVLVIGESGAEAAARLRAAHVPSSVWDYVIATYEEAGDRADALALVAAEPSDAATPEVACARLARDALVDPARGFDLLAQIPSTAPPPCSAERDEARCALAAAKPGPLAQFACAEHVRLYPQDRPALDVRRALTAWNDEPRSVQHWLSLVELALPGLAIPGADELAGAALENAALVAQPDAPTARLRGLARRLATAPELAPALRARAHALEAFTAPAPEPSGVDRAIAAAHATP